MILFQTKWQQFILAIVLISVNATILAQSTLMDITDLGGIITTQYQDSPSGEGVTNLIDNNSRTKFLTFHGEAWVRFQAISPVKLEQYALTSANDQPARDPQSWVFTASVDGTAWDTLDVKENQDFLQRFQRKVFDLSMGKSYSHFQFDFTYHGTDDYGRNILQLGEMELYASIDTPVAIMSVNRRFIFQGEGVTFENQSINGDVLNWSFPGGRPSSSQSANPVVIYDSTGIYPVSLQVISGSDTSIISEEHCMNVQRTGNWDTFAYPTVNFIDNTTGSKGSNVYHDLIDDPVQFNQLHCREVCRLIYEDQSDVPLLTKLEYKLDDLGGTPSYKWTAGPNSIGIAFNTVYLANVWESSNHDKDAVLYEIRGVLYHEETHGYQYSPRGCGGYEGGTDFFGFIEGLADFVRIRAGFHLTRSPDVNSQHKWNSGYTTTGFFIAYLQQEFDPNFAVALNGTAKTMNPWSWEAACQQILGKSIQELWDGYVTFINAGGKIKVDTPIYDEFTTAVSETASIKMPHQCRLEQNYPNPFNCETQIGFYLPVNTQIRLCVFNVMGQEVETLVDSSLPGGHHHVSWNAADAASGIYFYCLETEEGSLARRLMLVK
ncbi:T9SS type A sorting domain-containing protein [bacterium]|nr:T9SS type A sorting domain-containing protein [bacterium]